MNFSANKNDFLAALRVAGRAVSTKSPRPILSHVLIEITSEGGKISGTDLELTAKSAFKLSGLMTELGSVAVPAAMLNKIIAALPAGDINFTTAPNGQFVLQTGKIKQGINSLPGEEFPNPATPDEEKKIKIELSQLQRMLKSTIFATGDDAARPLIAGVNFKVACNEITAAATDTHRLAVSPGVLIKNEGVAGLMETFNFTMPGRMGEEILQLKEIGAATIAVNKNYLKLTVGDIEISTQLIAGVYPPWERLLPDFTEMSNKWVIKTEILMPALQRANIVSSTAVNKIRMETKGDNILIRTNSAEFGYSEENIPAEIEGEKTFYINVKFFIDILAAYNGEAVVISAQPADLRPVAITFPDEPGAVNIIMPMDSSGI